MRTAGQLRRYLLVEYRCVHRAACLLARVHATPHGFMLYRAAHTFSTTTTTPPMPLAGKSRAETAELLPDPPCSVHLGCDHGRFDRPPRARPQLPETAAGSPEARFVGGSQSLSATMAEHLGGARPRWPLPISDSDICKWRGESSCEQRDKAGRRPRLAQRPDLRRWPRLSAQAGELQTEGIRIVSGEVACER